MPVHGYRKRLMRLQPTKPEPRYNLEPIEFDLKDDQTRFIFSELLKNSRSKPMPERFRFVMYGMRETGGANRDRTGDLLLAKQALSQLSYGP
jgi:hypothetical protein